MKVLFLDVDGVLNYAGCEYKIDGTNMLGVDPKLVSMVQKIIKDTGCKVVLSSSWRLYKPDYDYIANLFDIYDTTPDNRGLTDRGCEVLKWLEQNDGVEVHAILDDASDFHKDQPLFKTDWQTGISEEVAQKVTMHLNGTIVQ